MFFVVLVTTYDFPLTYVPSESHGPYSLFLQVFGSPYWVSILSFLWTFWCEKPLHRVSSLPLYLSPSLCDPLLGEKNFSVYLFLPPYPFIPNKKDPGPFNFLKGGLPGLNYSIKSPRFLPTLLATFRHLWLPFSLRGVVDSWCTSLVLKHDPTKSTNVLQKIVTSWITNHKTTGPPFLSLPLHLQFDLDTYSQ